MPKRSLLLLIAAGVLALLAAFSARAYLSRQQQALRIQARQEVARVQESQAVVVIASRDISKGATIDPEMLETKVVPKEYSEPRAVSYPQRLVGMVAAVPISKGEQITLSRLVSEKQAVSTSLAMATPIGKRAISIPVDNISSLMGMIRPGDYVDVIGAIPVPVQGADGKQAMQMAVAPLFQNILVLAVGKELVAQSPGSARRYGREDEASGTVAPMVTLALSPQEANLIAFVQEQGKVRLVLRSPADSRIEPIQPANWETLFQYLMPQLPQAPGQPRATEEALQLPKEKLRQIEIYRGLKKENIEVLPSK